MTFDEVISQYAETAGISIEKASQYFSPDGCDLKNATYRILGIAINVTDSYQPTLEFYCKTAEHDQSWEITSIDAYILNRCYNGVIKQFDGEMEAWLRGECEIEYVINGDFYNNITEITSDEDAVDFGLYGLTTISFHVTETKESNYYEFCNEHHNIAFQKEV